MTELNPCPFCGGEAYVVPGVYRDGGYIENCAYVQCTKCWARTDEVSECMPEMQVYDMAVSTWNRRAERTCRDFGGEEGTNGEGYDFACSACGFCCDLSEPSYCPNCGARVEVDA